MSDKTKQAEDYWLRAELEAMEEEAIEDALIAEYGNQREAWGG